MKKHEKILMAIFYVVSFIFIMWLLTMIPK